MAGTGAYGMTIDFCHERPGVPYGRVVAGGKGTARSRSKPA